MKNKVLSDPREEIKLTVELSQYVKEGQSVASTKDQAGNVKIISIGDAQKYTVH